MSKKRIGINGINIKGQNRKKLKGLLKCLTGKGYEIYLSDGLMKTFKKEKYKTTKHRYTDNGYEPYETMATSTTIESK